MKQKQEVRNNHEQNDQNEFTTIRISREVYNDLSKRGRYRDTHSSIIARLLEDTGSNLQPSSSDGGSF